MSYLRPHWGGRLEGHSTERDPPMKAARPFETLELLKLLNSSPPGRERLLYFFLCSAGLRINEVLNLQWCSCLDAAERPLAYISAPLSKRRTGPLKRLIPLARVCIPDLMELYYTKKPAHPTEFIFARPGDWGKPITTRHASRLLFHRLRALKFKPGLSTHSFRKWLARQIFIASGKDVSMVQIVLGHKSPASTMFYLSPDSRRLRHVWSHVLTGAFGVGFQESVDTSADTDFQLAIPFPPLPHVPPPESTMAIANVLPDVMHHLTQGVQTNG